ncbi:MAG: hypothetical protein K8S54_15655 [Spirochaetia bacterium]|nr:hypothetical protein [Spirochaetia bacterium]
MDLRSLRKVPVPVAEDMIKVVRILAMTGRKTFVTYLWEPLREAGWRRAPAADTAKRMTDRIEVSAQEPSAVHTVAPLCKRLISQSLNETLSSVGDATIFFLGKMTEHTKVSTAPEAIDFVQVLLPKLDQFKHVYQNRSNELFTQGLQAMTPDDFKKAFAPVDLGKTQIKIEIQQEAAILFNKIQVANRNDDLPRCRKLIAHYMVQHADREDNNMSHVREVVGAFEKRYPGFNAELEEFMAISLHFQIVTAITQADIKKAIQGIRKYAHIFQGNPEVRYHLEVDRMEGKLYEIITEKGLWEELKKGG